MSAGRGRRANERGEEGGEPMSAGMGGGEPMSAGLLRRRCSERDLEGYAAAAAMGAAPSRAPGGLKERPGAAEETVAGTGL